MDVADLVRQHYGGDDLEQGILAAFAAAGVDHDRLTAADLSSIDQLHAGFVDATRYLLGQLDLTPATRLLDVGSGIGGPARTAAAEAGCPVVGIDLSPDFVATATALTARVGLASLVEFRVDADEGSGLEPASFDRAMMIHVGMNVPDKAAVFADVRRLLRPGGRFGLYEQMRVGDGPLPYPLPWADDERSSFVDTPDGYADALVSAGYRILRQEDRTAAVARPGGPPGRLSPAAVFGRAFVERIGNNVAATRAGLLGAVVMLAEKA